MENQFTKEELPDDKESFVANTVTTMTGVGQPLSIRTKMSLAEYKMMLQKQGETRSSVSAHEELSIEPTITRSETTSAGRKIQTVSVSQSPIPALVNPAVEKNNSDQVIVKKGSDDAGHPYLEIPVKVIHFIVNGKKSAASKLKQFSINGENNLFKINGNKIDVVPAKNFSGKTDPLKLAVTTVNGDQHVVDYTTVILRPVVVHSADHDRVTFQAGNDRLTLKEAGVVQAFFSKDGDNTTIVNITANGQTVGEAQLDPETGEIKLVKLTTYSGQLDQLTVMLYLEEHQKIECNYQPEFKDESIN
ncbi:hypothetical protein [Limosilactobacillus fastidiosus]|uniref:Uncharacterized protein n=1 Tax=Limosilactobacillus fastidiosus TaxID=2759855 RepID=A0A7W3TZP3_9LACO|nr:hypothetical protein [Limosilactobacillus fastidiosus]MBB1063811.1 hypothetical protein [Limosilactobacillus fastidiosus]MBB1086274.1 hypothetical protein [Limosilactobacillus fastidiosus]MCD7084386.1 hypothetical protein [Limosilactobacillus fastidiosus]MCD7086474.1 hypothetical protein [Limosilactobacillus fastidiosus]MCD7114456.1 hypothetical protein [Limosilactobacillus fastidiosus]